ncbi:hypothetical protein [Microbacterium timonense]|jgi:cytoskeletal protein RodZ|uniref:hypothetical protein n=1 Tax=Microbacterium timonense TaxID=2086576 RepID=UPI000D0FA51E|nr:hypothetical protein [Microbacterium timonense]
MTGTTPRRRHSPAVYRRRRLVLLLALLAVAAIVWLLIAQPWAAPASETTDTADKTSSQSTAESLPVPSGQAAPDPTDTGAVEGAVVEGTTPTAGSTPTAMPCVASEIIVEPVTSADTYAGDQNPQFSIKLTNNGPDCTLNVGTSAQSFTVTSGDDVWWRSTDCQGEPSDMIVLIAAGQTVTSAAPLTWDRTRSAVGTCADATRPRAPGGGASYHLSVEIGGIASTDPKQFLLY